MIFIFSPVAGLPYRSADPPPVRRENNLYLVELGAGRAGNPQFSGGFGKFDLDQLSTSLIAAIHPFPVFDHFTPYPFRAKL
jgi:hypothetical protein